MKIVYSRNTKRWFAKMGVQLYRLSYKIDVLCKRSGVKSYNKLYIHIKKRGIDSEYIFSGNKIIIGNDAPGCSKRLQVKAVLLALLHELRHFMQYRAFSLPLTVSYSEKDMKEGNASYYNDPLEKDARKYEKKNIKRLMGFVFKP